MSLTQYGNKKTGAAGRLGILALASLVAGAVCYKWFDKRVAYYFEFLPLSAKKGVDLVSKLSASEFVLPLGAAIMLWGFYRHKPEPNAPQALWPYAFVPVSLFLTWLLKRNLKFLITRKRPLHLLLNQEYGFRFFVSDEKQEQSFPSGHSTVIFALAHSTSRTGLFNSEGVYTAAALLALSRAPLNKHYLSDIVGGAFFGMAVPELLLHLGKKTELISDGLKAN